MNDNQTTSQSEYRTGGIYISQSDHETAYISAIHFLEQPKSGSSLCWLDVSMYLGHEKSDVLQPFTFEDAGFIFHPLSIATHYGVICGERIALCTDKKQTRMYHYLPSTKPFSNAWYKKTGNHSSQDLDYKLVTRGNTLYIFDSGKKQFEKYAVNLQHNANGVYTLQFDLKDWKRKSKKDKSEPIVHVTLHFFGYIVLWRERQEGSNKETGHWLIIDHTESALNEDPMTSKSYSARSQ